MTFQSCVANDHWWAYSSCQFARHLRITPRRNTIITHHPRGICTKNFHHHHPRSLNLHKIVNRFVRAYFIYRANCLYKENNTMYITDITDIQGEDISYKLWKLVSNPIVVIKDNKICLNYITVFVDLWTIIFYCELQ